MPYYAYVLKSLNFNRCYKGHCSDLDNRLKAHNIGKTKATAPFRPWEVVYFEEYTTLSEAIARENYFKTAAGRRYLKDKI